MKKILSFIVILFIAILLVGNVKAKSSELEITNVEIIEKSDSVKANIENYKDLNINLNTLFFNNDDYVKYKISIKNNTNNTMKIDDILDNFNSEVLETSYDIEKNELKSNEEYTFTMTIKCIKDIDEERVTITSPLNIIINYDNGKTATIDINPNTKDSIITYFIIFVLSAISLLLVITKKGKKQLLGLMLLVSLIPITSNAVSTKKTLTINNDIKVYGKTAVFKKGVEVNKQLKDLAGTDTSTNVNVHNIVDRNIKEFKRSNELPDGFIPSEENIISTDESRIPIYAWFDNGIIYYYTEANTPLLNEDSSLFFMFFTSLEKIKFDDIDTSNVININGFFNGCYNLFDIKLNSFDTRNTIYMAGVFQDCKKLEEIDLSNFDTSNVENMSYMFNGCINLKVLNLTSFNTSNVTTMRTMFQNCEKLEDLDLSNFDTSNVTIMAYMFYNCRNLSVLNLSRFNTSNVTTMRNMFQSCEKLEDLDLSNFNTSNVTDMSYMFNKCYKIRKLNLKNFNTSNVINMSTMFQYCEELEELDISNFDTSSVTNMAYMFWSCKKLNSINLLKFNTENVTSMRSMFGDCISLEELDLSNFNTSKVTDMSWMFGVNPGNDSKLFKLDISNFNTSNVLDMSSMFENCTNLEELDLSNFDTSKVTNMHFMFGVSDGNESRLSHLNIGSFDTSNVTTMRNMFQLCNNIEEIDLSSFDTTNVTDMAYMFGWMNKLNTIYVSDKFITDNVTSSNHMFTSDTNLVGGNGTTYNNSYRDKTYGRIDTEDTPGYFTLKNS